VFERIIDPADGELRLGAFDEVRDGPVAGAALQRQFRRGLGGRPAGGLADARPTASATSQLAGSVIHGQVPSKLSR